LESVALGEAAEMMENFANKSLDQPQLRPVLLQDYFGTILGTILWREQK
jgi:hypothetical protein